MYIIHVTSELAPIAKVGGLADVLYGLSQETCRMGHTVEVILPKYDCIDTTKLQHVKKHRRLFVPDGAQRYGNTIWQAKMENLNLLLIETDHPKQFFNRQTIYGCSDDLHRFTYFSKVVLDYLYQTHTHPDIIHLHDWPTALISMLYQKIYRPLDYQISGCVLTIHNLEHQGKYPYSELIKIGLEKEGLLAGEDMQDPHTPSHINLLRGGIEYADQITTVSPSYEKEIQTNQGGCGLQKILIKNQHKLHGILNGIDPYVWNPHTDPLLQQHYTTDHIKTPKQLDLILSGKQENKHHLRKQLNLNACDRPLVACVTRLVPQKGPELIKIAIERTLEKKGQCILLGSTPNPTIRASFEQLQQDPQHAGHLFISMTQNETLAHLIFSAADLFIIPSLFEPCGLTQMIALRYGTIPIVRSTGGLADTVFDIDTSSKPLDERNGFTFEFPDREGVYWALDRALDCYTHDPKKWRQILNNGIKTDFSWKHATQHYLTIYDSLIPKQPQ